MSRVWIKLNLTQLSLIDWLAVSISNWFTLPTHKHETTHILFVVKGGSFLCINNKIRRSERGIKYPRQVHRQPNSGEANGNQATMGDGCVAGRARPELRGWRLSAGGGSPAVGTIGNGWMGVELRETRLRPGAPTFWFRARWFKWLLYPLFIKCEY